MWIENNGDKIFKVVPENKTIYGVSKRKDLTKEIMSNCSRRELATCLTATGLFNLFWDQENQAKAVCDESDRWDADIGIDVVSAKLDLKEHLRAAKIYNRACLIMNSAMRKMEDLCQKHAKKAKAIQKDLDEYYGRGKKR